ncbi:MAG TPA: hypothetical protein VMS18_18730 [Candidatus Binatia bacterium]|nr:hypothetical protein [Candidatus Binatia bacterium]
MDPDIWDLIVLGRGSSARYHLTTIERELFPNILVIGLEDPWAGDRGYDEANTSNPVNKINQTADMIESFDQPVPAFTKELVDRLTFAKETSGIIDRIATKVVTGEVVDVDVSDDEIAVPRSIRDNMHMRVFSVRLKNGDKYCGKKVVVATGAGPHQEPVEVKGLSKKHPEIVMDMNTFGRKAGTFSNPEKQTVFIHGPNAAIDTADTAKFQKFNVVWLVKEGVDIPLLATGHQTYAANAVKNDVKRYPAVARGTAAFKVTVAPGALNQVTVTIGNEVIWGTLYVYGMGQDPEEAMKGVIPPKLRNQLVPVYDINQRHGATYETVHAFKLENSDWDNGFEIVGALCTQVARKKDGVKHTYLKEQATMLAEVRGKVLQHVLRLKCMPHTDILFMELDRLVKYNHEVALRRLAIAGEQGAAIYPTWKNQLRAVVNLMVNYLVARKHFGGREKVDDEDLNHVTKILTPSTVAHAQLGGIRASTAAINAFVTKTPNLSQDDRTILRFSIAVNYPFVSERDAQAIIGDIVAGRRNKDLGGYGYEESQKSAFLRRLEQANAQGGYMAVTQPKTFGTNQTQPKQHAMVQAAPRLNLHG